MKKVRLNLDQLKVKSFVTGKEVNQSTILGGGTPSQADGCGGTAMSANCTEDPCGPFDRQ